MKAPDNYVKKPRFIGPGTIVALVAVLAIGLWNMKYLQPHKEQPGNIVSDPQFTSPDGPGIELILDESVRLKLAPEQFAQLQAIQSEWLKESEPLTRRLRERTLEMRKYMNAAGKRRPTIDEIQRHAQPMSEASAEYARLRKAYRKKALSLLKPDQAALWENISKEKRNRQ